jgi:ParB family chromosome partitioning protein
LSVSDQAGQERLADKIINEDLSVRAAEAAAAQMRGAKPKKPTVKPGGRADHFAAIANKLGDKLDTRVSVALGKSKGTITIEFATVADLNRIATELGVNAND